MGFDLQWLLWALPIAFGLGWLASRWDVRQWRKSETNSPKAYFKGLNLLLNEQQDKAIDAFIEAIQQEPGTSDLHFALGNLFRRRGEYERSVRVHQHLLDRGDLSEGERQRAMYALANDYLKAGLMDRAEEALKSLSGTSFDMDAKLALLGLYERSRDWRAAVEVAQQLESRGTGSFASRIAHYWCEIALEADARQRPEEALTALKRAREVAPQSPRALIIEGQRLQRQGHSEQALAVWSELLAAQPQAASLIALEMAQVALSCHQEEQVRQQLRTLYSRLPSVQVLQALMMLTTDAMERRGLAAAHLRQHASLTASQWIMQDSVAHPEHPLDKSEADLVLGSLGSAAKPLQRYRCAACGFEAHHFFWQCPGCQTWDSYPPHWQESA